MLYFDQISRTAKFLSAEEEAALSAAAQRGDARAREQLIASQLPFVVYVAKQYQARGIDLEDLVQLGNVGLIRAAAKFDPRKGRFSTYAGWWIRHFIRIELERHASQIRLPQRSNRKTKPKLEEAAERALAAIRKSVPAEEAFLIAPDDRDRDDLAESIAELRREVAALPERVRYVIESRLAGKTLKEIGGVLHVGRERVRQIEADAIAILRRRLGAERSTS
jgi:RNA polymerase sigma factor (sigma-70 family)